MKQNSFYFIRHGETELNSQNKCCGGGTDIPLNEIGKNQALSLKNKIKDYHFSKVISSSMLRAQETTKILLGSDFIINAQLKEWNIGIYEKRSVKSFLPYIEDYLDTTPIPNGESKKAFYIRVMKVINKAMIDYKNDFLIVAHGGVYWAILDALKFPRDPIQNCEFIYFYRKNDVWSKVVL